MKKNNLLHALAQLKSINLGECLFTLSLFLFVLVGCEESIPEAEITVSAGADRVVNVGESFTLNGSATASTGENLTTVWELVSKPNDSNLAIINPNSLSINLVADALGNYIFKFTATSSSGISESDDIEIVVEPSTIILTDINEDTVLENIWEEAELADYRVPGTVRVNAALTIRPGVRIVFEQGAEMLVNSSGSISAVGEVSSQIIFTGVQASEGYWEQLAIFSNSPENTLEHFVLEYAGASSQSLLMNSGRLVMKNSTIRHSASYGIHLENRESYLVDFENNSITENNIPVYCLPEHFKFFDGSTDFSGNTIDYIEGFQNRHIEEDGTWQKLNVPYYLPGTINNVFSDLTISPGTEILVGSDGGLFVTEEGSLSAVGTATEPISFSGEEQIPGFWTGLIFSTNTAKNELTYIDIRHGGGIENLDLKGNVVVQDEGRLKITNATLSDSDGYGLIILDDESIVSPFTNNIVTSNKVPISATPWHFGFFDASSDFSGNEEDAIDGKRHTTLQLEDDATWKKLNVPYSLPKTRLITIGSQITLEAGTEFIGYSDAGIVVRDEGTLTAIGSTDEPIIFRGFENIPGYWIGISFETLSNANRLEHVHVSDGGQVGFLGSVLNTMIEVSGKLVTKNCNISNSEGIGVYIKKEGSFESMDNSYSNNPEGDVVYEE